MTTLALPTLKTYLFQYRFEESKTVALVVEESGTCLQVELAWAVLMETGKNLPQQVGVGGMNSLHLKI